MDILGISIEPTSVIKKIKTRLNFLEKSTPRADLDVLLSTQIYKAVSMPVSPIDLYDTVNYSSELRGIIHTLKKEIFRNGAEFTPKFVTRCVQCGKEFDYEEETCDSCGDITEKPDFNEVKFIEKFFHRVNNNNQTLFDVLGEFEDDLNIMDQAFMVLIKDYMYDEVGNIVSARVKEIVRFSPVVITGLFDKQGRLGYDEDGKKVLVCPEHRDVVIFEGKGIASQGVCPIDGKKLFQAFFKATNTYSTGALGGEVYYIEGEVIFLSKYTTSLVGGFPPVLSVYNKVHTLLAMDLYMREYYGKQRPPKGLFLINTRNPDGLTEQWDKLLIKTAGNPHNIYPFAVNSNSARGQSAQFIDFMNTLTESQYVDTRNELRTTIGAFYGVTPIFQSDVSAGGGLNNEGLQITVTNRAVESGQTLYNNKLFPMLLEQLDIHSFEYILQPSEEQDETAEIDRNIKKAQLAQQMLQMGFDVELENDGEFKFSGEAKLIPGTEGLPGFGATPPFGELGDQNFDAMPASMHMTKTKLPIRASGDFKDFLSKEFDKILKRLNYKNRPSKSNMQKAISEITGKIKDFLRVKSTAVSNRCRHTCYIYIQSSAGGSKYIGSIS